MNDDYYDSDIAWLDLEKPKFDIILAPYETYLDDLMGVKTSYGAAVLIRNDSESRRLALYEKYVPEMQEALPLAAEDKPSKQGQRMPMEVMDSPFRTGDLGHGYQAVADNLPNDARIHAEKGTQEDLLQEFYGRPRQLRHPAHGQARHGSRAGNKVTGEGYLATTLMHEIAHGLGPTFARVNGKQVDIREAIGASYSGLEEAKADVVGMLGLQWLMDKGYVSKDKAEEYYVSYVADLFRSMRFGAGEAHSTAETMEFNYLSEQGAIRRDPVRPLRGGRSQDCRRNCVARQGIAGDRGHGRSRPFRKVVCKLRKLPRELTKALESAKNVPVDIDPVFTFPRKIQ